MDTSAPPDAAPPRPGPYVTPECFVGRTYPEVHDQCRYPGYDDPVLGRVKVECACEHHAAAVAS